MKKTIKILLITLLLVVCCGFICACGDDSEDQAKEEKVKITDCVESYKLTGIEEGVAYWDVYFNDKFNEQSFDGLDFFDCIKECVGRDENKTDDVVTYSVHGTDNNGMLRFAWGYGLEDYQIVHEWDENGTAEKHNYSLTNDMLIELDEAEK